jgi:hypothetical protein
MLVSSQMILFAWAFSKGTRTSWLKMPIWLPASWLRADLAAGLLHDKLKQKY